MRVLVTGATGFVGSHTARALVEAGHRVRVLVRNPDRLAALGGLAARVEVAAGDMTDAAAVGRALDDQDAVVHAAALVRLERKHAARVLAANRAGVEQVIGAAAARGVPRILYVSSAVALFHPDGDSPYTRSKTEAEQQVRALQAQGAPIRTTYPAGVLGPDDPGLSASNRGLVALCRVPVVTRGGLQLVDVRDVAAAHVRLLELPPGPGGHLLCGHFLRWSEVIDRLEAITGHRFRRLPVPGPLLRAAGAVCDAIQRVHDLELPLTLEAARIMTQWTPIAPDPRDGGLGIAFRDPAETIRDTLRWLHATTGVDGCASITDSRFPRRRRSPPPAPGAPGRAPPA